MCGITGFLNSRNLMNGREYHSILEKMTGTMVHRGPDSENIWMDRATGIALGHRRLSIIDLSQEGSQPMLSANHRYLIVYNGEIYNFQEIRSELGDAGLLAAWRGHSDTEVMLAAFCQWGVETSLKKFNGMFAFALWDREERVLYLARDRMGKKPLYYGWMGDVFLFGSELKALLAHPAWVGEVDRDVLTQFLRFGYIHSPHSIYKGIFKLPSGCYLQLPSDRMRPQNIPDPIPFWSAGDVALNGLQNPFSGDEGEAVAALDKLVRDAVKRRMISDVPLGVLLSGGIDSSLITAIMQKLSDRPVKSFSIGFDETQYDEAKKAKAVAKYLGTDHTEMYVTPNEAMAVIPRLPTLYDEPFADSSQIPTFLVFQLARHDVAVALSGDGGDELFGGYNWYRDTLDKWNKIAWLPYSCRKPVADFITTVSAVSGCDDHRMDQRLQKISEILSLKSPYEFYRWRLSHNREAEQMVIGGREPQTVFTNSTSRRSFSDLRQWMMYVDMVSFLPDDILVKVDRASMGVSLEARAPLLDYRIVKFAWQLPLKMKIRNGYGKWLLRQLLERYLPLQLVDRTKVGFGIPVGEWLRRPLRDWAENLLNEKKLSDQGFLNPRLVRERWNDHLTGKRKNLHYYLWHILMFQAWLEAYQ
jgi:asparagine synthase (glutamine-hydrolysing)